MIIYTPPDHPNIVANCARGHEIATIVQDPNTDPRVKAALVAFIRDRVHNYHNKFYNSGGEFVRWLSRVKAYLKASHMILMITVLCDSLQTLIPLSSAGFGAFRTAFVDSTSSDEDVRFFPYFNRVTDVIPYVSANNLVIVPWPYDRMCRLSCCDGLPNRIRDHAVRDLFDLIRSGRAKYIALVYTADHVSMETDEHDHNPHTITSGSESFKSFLRIIENPERMSAIGARGSYTRVKRLTMINSHDVTRNCNDGHKISAHVTVQYVLYELVPF